MMKEGFARLILMKLLTQKSNLKNKKKAQGYCLCRRSSFPPMKACDNKVCKTE